MNQRKKIKKKSSIELRKMMLAQRAHTIKHKIKFCYPETNANTYNLYFNIIKLKMKNLLRGWRHSLHQRLKVRQVLHCFLSPYHQIYEQNYR